MPLITKTVIEKPLQVHQPMTSFKGNTNIKNKIESFQSEERPYANLDVKSMIQTPYRYGGGSVGIEKFITKKKDIKSEFDPSK
jgi:hypothetical protein